MSSMIGGRSANRGTCAQACRLPYTLRDEDSDAELSAPGDRLLSPKDLCTIDMLPKLAETGVDSLKIEGRMKSPEYVFAVVAAYRAAIDRLACAIDEGTSLEEAGATLSLIHISPPSCLLSFVSSASIVVSLFPIVSSF